MADPTETRNGFCHVCGGAMTFLSYEPVTSPCKRNTFLCPRCGACARNRHAAMAILGLFPIIGPRLVEPASSLQDFAQHWRGRALLTCTSGAIHAALSANPNCVASEYIDDAQSGEIVNGALCQDLQRTSFLEGEFDLVVTEDVMEHIPNPRQAFAEIRRILKPGGYHIATIPINWGRQASATRAVIANGEIVHFMEPEIHGDPTRPDKGILAFTDYGPNIIDEYLSITGPSWMLSANGDSDLETAYGIYNSWVFISRRAN